MDTFKLHSGGDSGVLMNNLSVADGMEKAASPQGIFKDLKYFIITHILRRKTKLKDIAKVG